MLGKLFKHEFSEIARLLIPLNLILITVALVGNVALRIDLLQKGPLSLIPASITVVYVLTIFTLFILTAVYLTIRFYKTMYASQGYLTHTLPVSTASVLNVKIITSVFWLAAAFVIAVCSAFLLHLGHSGSSFHINLTLLDYEISTVIGLHLWQFFLAAAAMLIVFCFSCVLMVYASLAVGQLFRQYRIPAAIGAYIVFYIIQQIVSLILLMIFGIAQIDAFEQLPNQASAIAYSNGFFQRLYLLILVQAAAFGFIYYILCYTLSKKHLNLE